MKKIKTITSFPVVGIGGSAGGLKAFRELLKNLPDNTGMAFVFIMHLLPEYKSVLTELLAEAAKMPVIRVKSGMPVEANHVYVIPPDMNMSIAGGKLFLSNMNKTGLRMPVDYFFYSLAKEMGTKAIGIILSGTAADGTLGAGAIKAEGGITFAQDDKTAEYDGMPKSAIASGCIDFVFSPDMIARELARIAKHPVNFPAEAAKLDGKGFKEIFDILRAANGLDFTNYKDATMTRRILRRMSLLKFKKLNDYLKFLRGNKDEAGKLCEDLLINVTGFFRDPGVFNMLKKKVLTGILKKKTKDQDIRIWVSGCSSGEDVYSIAICLLEVMGNKTRTVPVQIFATDVSENSISKARRGKYEKNIKDNITPERLKRFFTKEGDFYKVSKQLREICVFSKQNVFNDPPFSNIDLIICRNLLIYFQPVLQKKVFQNFHYSLVPGGFLILGSSESVGGYSSFFDTLDRKHRIFVKKYLPVRLPPEFSGKYYQPKKLEIKGNTDMQEIKENDIGTVIERVLLNEYVPCGALIDNNMEVVQFRGRTGRFLESAAGRPSLNIFKLAREGLLLPLRSAIYKARVTKQTVKKEADNVKYNNRKRRVNITVIPVKHEGPKVDYFLVLFEEITVTVPSKDLKKASGKSLKDEKYVEAMQKELLETKEYLQTVIEAQEGSNEELKTANEEILSSNEELQSANEELETSKEELQSSNEELTTTNEELNNRNAEVTQLNNDLLNLLGSINMPVIMMDTGLVIHRITFQAEKTLNLTSSDIGRPINKIKLNVDIPDLEQILLDVIESLHPKTLEIKDKYENWYSLYVRPYRTMDNKIDGVVVIFIDITKLKRVEEALRETNEYLDNLFNYANAPIIVWTPDFKITRFNRAFERLTGRKADDVIGKPLEILFPPFLVESSMSLIRKTLSGERWETVEIQILHLHGNIRTVLWNSATIFDPEKKIPVSTIAQGQDITERKRAEEALRESEDKYRTMIDHSNDMIWTLDSEGNFLFFNKRAEEISGFSQKDLIGKSFAPLILKEDLPRTIEMFNKTLKGESLQYEVSFYNKEGRLITLLVDSTPLFSKGLITGTISFGKDITERKEVDKVLREREELYRTLLENVDLSICLIDKDHKLIMANSRFCEMFGLNRDEIIGMHCFSVYNKRDSVCPDCPSEKAMSLKKVVKIETERICANGTHLPVNINTYPVYDSNKDIKYFIKIMEDISEFKKIEQAKRNMIRDISHSLKTPIAMIEMAFDISKNSINSGDKEGMEKAGEIASENIKKLRKDITNILQEFAIDVHKDVVDKTKEAPLKAAVTKITNELRPLIDEKRLQLDINLAPNADKVKIDGRDLETVLNNLLDNAIKFAEKGKISVTGRLNDKMIEIEVKDTGCGISAKDIGKVFEKFYKRHASIEGTGLGLSICKELVEIYNGEIKIFSEGIGKGAVVTVSLPKA